MDNDTQSQSRQLGAAFLVVGWIAIIAVITLLLNNTLFGSKGATIRESDIGKEIVLTRDRDSHFRVKGHINGIAVEFLIDTGATSIVISDELARKAGLAKKAALTTETAGGQSQGYLTEIERLDIGGIEVDNISAVIIPELDPGLALLGMNLLQKFSMQQNENTMILTVNRDSFIRQIKPPVSTKIPSI